MKTSNFDQTAIAAKCDTPLCDYGSPRTASSSCRG